MDNMTNDEHVQQQARTQEKSERLHKATYTRDTMRGGYNIWVEGPHANRFAGRTVPVTRKDGTEEMEELEELQWSGINKDTGVPASVYTFKKKEREEEEAHF